VDCDDRGVIGIREEINAWTPSRQGAGTKFLLETGTEGWREDPEKWVQWGFAVARFGTGEAMKFLSQGKAFLPTVTDFPFRNCIAKRFYANFGA
jgi:hypothetical protein